MFVKVFKFTKNVEKDESPINFIILEWRLTFAIIQLFRINWVVIVQLLHIQDAKKMDWSWQRKEKILFIKIKDWTLIPVLKGFLGEFSFTPIH
jgi:hypothetical protein